jgi:CheY-like chemotaxis protein
MDVVMPHMNGFEACRQLRQHPEVKAIPIVLISTRGGMENREAGLRAGGSDYITKPLDRGEVLAALERHLKAPAAP